MILGENYGIFRNARNWENQGKDSLYNPSSFSLNALVHNSTNRHDAHLIDNSIYDFIHAFLPGLHYHVLKVIPNEINTAKRLKSNLPKIVKGGYNRDKFANLIETAMENSEIADTEKGNYFPVPKTTKLYLLVSTLLRFLGNNWNK